MARQFWVAKAGVGLLPMPAPVASVNTAEFRNDPLMSVKSLINNNMKSLLAGFTLGLALLGAAATAQAQATYDTWVGNTSANFSGLNWTGANSPPVSGDTLVFGPAGTSGTALNADQAAGIHYVGITFNTNADEYTINGTNGITLTGGITNNSGNADAETLNFPINCPDRSDDGSQHE